ncbi:TIGR01777 family protein [bacterium I07]|nr:TIGR01777 family protein [bacterium I07]
MKAMVTGATGMIGRRLCTRLLDSGAELIVLSRNPEKPIFTGQNVRVEKWPQKVNKTWADSLEGVDAVINLAGESIAAVRWTADKKARILNSRKKAAAIMAESIELAEQKPGILVQASAIGIYGDRQDEELDESSGTGAGFLADVCKVWENSSSLSGNQTRRVIIRIGKVLGKTGLLPRLALPYRLFAGGHMGSSRRWFSWIHIDDVVSAVMFAINNPAMEGVFNLTAPEPVLTKEFNETLARILNRPCWFHIPDLAIRLFMGQMGEELLLSGQKVFPSNLLKAGFQFKYTRLDNALKDLLKEGRDGVLL